MDRKSSQPVAHLPVTISYSYTGYGAFYMLRIPKPEAAETDDQGIATLPMADFSGSIAFEVNHDRFLISKHLIRHGGLVQGGFWDGKSWSKMDYHPPPYIVWLAPLK